MPSKRSSLLRQGSNFGVQSLLDLLPLSLCNELVDTLSLDQGVKKLTHPMLFKLILYSLFSPVRISLRRMQEHASNPRFAYFNNATLEYIGYTSIRSALLRAEPAYFQSLYTHVYSLARSHNSSRALSKRFGIKIYDSTMVAVFAHLLNGMKVGNSSKNKRQVKFTTELSEKGLVHMRFFSDQAHLSEETALKESIQARDHGPTDIVVFDAGLKSRKTFQEFDEAGIQFVTRLAKSPKHRVIRETPDNFEVLSSELKAELPQSASVIRDQIVHLAQDGGKWLEHEFRLIEVDIGEKESLWIATNIMNLDPQIIAAIYRMRWEIEVFFRFLKQEMDFTHFISNDPKAIEIMMYCTMIAAMAILVYKQKAEIKSYKKAKVMFLTALDHLCMLALLEDDVGTSFLKEQIQKALQQNFITKK